MNYKYINKILPVIGSFILCIILLSPYLFKPGTVLTGDTIEQFLPWKHFLITNLKNNHLPLWDPLSFSGYSFLTNIQATMFYPTTVLYYILKLPGALKIDIILHYLLIISSLYLVLKQFNLSNLPVFFGIISFLFSGFLVTTLYKGHLTILYSISWYFLLFYFFIKILRTPDLKNSLLLSLGLSLIFLGGQPQFYLFALYSVITFFIILLWRYRAKHSIKCIMLSISIIIIHLLLISVQLIPLIEAKNFLIRQGLDLNFINQYSLSQYHFLLIFFDFIYGSATNFWLRSFENLAIYTGYLSLIILIYFIIRREYLKLIIPVIILSSMAIGTQNPLFLIIVKYLPGFQYFRAPIRFLLFWNIGILILYVLFFKHLFNDRLNYKILFRIFLAGFIITVVTPFIIPYYYNYLKLNHKINTSNFNPTLNLKYFIFINTAFLFITILLKLKNKLYFKIFICIFFLINFFTFACRYLSYTNLNRNIKSYSYLSKINNDNSYILFKNNFRMQNINYFYNLPAIKGYNPIVSHKYLKFLSIVNNTDFNKMKKFTLKSNRLLLNKVSDKLLYFTGVKYLFNKKLSKTTEPSNSKLKIYTNYISGNDRQFPKVIDTLYRNKICFINKKNLQLPETTENSPVSYKIIEYDYLPGNLKILIETDKDSILEFKENYYPGWQVYLNNQKAELITVNNIYMGVRLNKGVNRVQFKFKPKYFYLTLLLSGITLVTVLIFLIFGRGKTTASFL